MRWLPGTRAAWVIGWIALAISLTAGAPAYAQQGQDGLSLEEYYRFSPPHPEAVTAAIRAGKAIVSWKKPKPPPPGRIGYDPVVVRYNIYRLGENEHRTLIGKTTGTTFIDPAPLRPDTARRYGVTALQRSGHESGMSADAELRIP